MVAELLITSVDWVIGFITALGWPLVVLLAVSAVSAGTVIGRQWVHRAARERRVIGRWRLIVRSGPSGGGRGSLPTLVTSLTR